MNRTVKGLVAVGLGLTILTGGGFAYSTHDKLEEATENVNRLEQKVENKEQKVTQLSNKKDKLDKKIEKLNKKNETLQEENKDIGKLNDELSKEVKTLKGTLESEYNKKVAESKAIKEAKERVAKTSTRKGTEKKVKEDKQVEKKKEEKVVEKKKEDKKAEEVVEEKVEEVVKSENEKPEKSSNAVSKKTFKLEATMYTAFCDTGCIGVTATGVDVSDTNYHKGMKVVAVDPNVIPLNTVMEIEYSSGAREKAIAVDTGGAIKGHRIDIITGSKEEALNFGRQGVTVRVLDWG